MARVLIVEDNDMLSRAYQMILEREGHEVVLAFDGKEALEKLKKISPSIILLDLLMPKMGGVDFLKIYKVPTHRDVKVVILSNFDNEEGVQEAMELGAHKYILKANMSPEDLSALVYELEVGQQNKVTKQAK